MRFLLFYITLLTVIYVPCVSAQQNDIYTSYGVDDGLSQSSVWSIVQDRQGFLWIGTSDGICRFDGYKFAVYRAGSSDSNILAGGTYNKFYCDSDNNLWSVSQNGICFYDKIKDKFVMVFNYRPNISTNYNCIVGEDKQYLFAGMCGLGILKIDKKTHTFSGTNNDPTAGIPSWLNVAFCNGEVWVVGNDAGCYVYDMSRRALSVLPVHNLRYIINYNDSELLAAAEDKVVVFNKRDRSWKTFPIEFSKKAGAGVTGILPLPAGKVLLSTSVGLFYLDAKNWKIVRHVESFTNGAPNTFSYVQCICKDRSGNIWIGTNGDGLKKLMAPYKKFKFYSSFNSRNNMAKAIYADNKNLYVGYYGIGLDVFDRRNGLIRSEPVIAGMPAATVLAINSLDSSDLILFVGGANSVSSYSITRQVSNDISGKFKKAVNVSSLNSSHPFFLKEGNSILININESHLVTFDITSPQAIRPVLLRDMAPERLNCAYRQANGTLWLGTMNRVLYFRDTTLCRVALPELVHVKSINEDAAGNVWVATIKGIFVIDSNKRVTRHYTESNGLTNQFVYGILRDDDGNMWFSHNKGLSVYNTASNTFRHYMRDDGLQSNEFNTGAYFKAADGELFFGGINGVNSFYPREVKDNPNIPEVVITSIRLFDMPLQMDTAYWQVQTITLPYTQNSLSFEFSALEFTNPAKNQYAYMMEGVDDKWINSGDRRFARYAALPPGQYVFKVKASNNDEVWQNTPRTIVINIVPPFWHRLWFRILAVLLLMGCLSGVITWTQRQRHKRQIRALELQQKIQLERERISRDLHDTVGTQLSLISNNIEWVAHPLKVITENEKAEKLQFVNNTARDIIATLRETIWALNKQQIPLEEFSDKLKAFVQKQLVMYPEIELNFIEKIGEGIILGPSEALNLFRICQEAIANALKYAKARTIDIEIGNVNGKYHVSVADNGSGFDVSLVDPTVHNGLENMKYRAQDIDAVLVLQSESGKGTRVTVTKK